MRIVKALLAALLLLALVGVGYWRYRLPPRPVEVIGAVQPDLMTRRAVEKLDPSQIAALKFCGLDFGRFENDPIVVTDARLIERFLTALHHASGRLIMNRVDNLEIHLKPQNGKKPEPIRLALNPARQEDSFRPEFQEALRALSEYQAQQWRDNVRRNAAAIRSIDVSPLQGQPQTITDPQEVARLLEALQQVDGRGFAYAAEKRTLIAPSVLLKQQDGREKDIVFVLDTATLSTAPPLPEALWRYCYRPDGSH